jgi:hypothetical protein
MSDAETKPADKSDRKPAVVETKPASKAGPATGKPAEAKPANKAENKAVGKVESRQAGKGSKRRPFNAKRFDANYQAIHWGRGQSQKPKH